MSQTVRDTLFIPSDNRANFKNVIAKRSDLTKFSSGRMKKAGAGLIATYQPGLVVGYASTGADAGSYKAYAAGNTDGSQIPVGVLSEKVETDEFGNGSLCAICIKGELFEDLLIGLDAGAKTALGAKLYVENGVNLIII